MTKSNKRGYTWGRGNNIAPVNHYPNAPVHLPFIAKATANNKDDSAMKVMVEGNGHPGDFDFVLPLLEAFRQLPFHEGIFFPKMEGGLVRCEVGCQLEYVGGKPTGTLTFLSTKLGLKMRYLVQVSLIGLGAHMGLKVRFVPDKKLDKLVYRTTESNQTSYDGTVKAICRAFTTGSTYRKIGHLPPPKEK